MKAASSNLDPSFDAVLQMVRKLSRDEKIKLSEELERELIDIKLSRLLKVFRTDELTGQDIAAETESVRAAIYARSKSK